MSYVNSKRQRRDPNGDVEELEERADFEFNRMDLPSFVFDTPKPQAALTLLPPPEPPALVGEGKIYELSQIIEAEYLVGQLIPRLSPPYAVKPITDQLSVQELTIIFQWIKDGLRDARLSVLSETQDG